MTEPRKPSDVVTREILDERTCRLMAVLNSAKELELARHEAIEAKLSAANEVLEQRLHYLNELRGNVITKGEYLSQHNSMIAEHHGDVKVLQTQINNLIEWKAEQKGKASMLSVMVVGVGMVIGWAIGIAGLIHSYMR